MIYLDDLLQATGGCLAAPPRVRSFEGFGYDSRIVRPGELFVAVRTERGDGHDFIGHALARGASGILAERLVPEAPTAPAYLLVPDTRQALQQYARFVLARYRPLVIAVAGSIGKTTTQHAIIAALTHGDPADASVFGNDNFNDLFGLPIALGRLRPDHQTAVLELGADAFGDLGRLADLVRPRLAVITNVAPVHLEAFGTLENVARELAAVLARLPADGVACLNADDPLVAELAGATAARVVTFGRGRQAQVRAPAVWAGPEETRFVLTAPDQSASVTWPLLGQHTVYAALAAAAVGLALGFDLAEVAQALSRLRPLPGRLRRLAGRDGVVLLDDTFSASPPSVLAALEVLAGCPSPRLAVLGAVSGLTALEGALLGPIGQRLAAVCDCLVVCGERAEPLARAARAAGLLAERLVVTESPEDALAALRRLAGPGATVLVKGAESARMERVVAGLLADPADQSALVRQDAGWRQRVFISQERPTWLEIDLEAIGHNLRLIQETVGPGVGVLAVLKADAYGHGLVRVARTAVLHGAVMLGTACLSEAVTLRERGIDAPILILGYTPPWQARDIVRYRLIPTVFSREVARHLARAAEALGVERLPVHIKIDTGLGRLGLLPEEAPAFLAEVADLPRLEIEGLFTHFATADSDLDYARWQLQRFREVLAAAERLGLRPRYLHAANSAAIVRLPEARFNLVRAGLALYGLSPVQPPPPPYDRLRPALQFKSQVAQVKTLPPGSGVSYGRTFVTTRPTRVAVIPVGYGDGFRRGPRHWGEVLVRGRRAPIIGVVCMDMCMLDVTEIPEVRPGDEVVLIGQQGGERITVEEVAERLGTIPYEVITQILPRVPREVR